MDLSELRNHWDNVYKTKSLNEVSWYEPIPANTLSVIHEINLPKNAAILDAGGGDSLLVDYLIEEGYTDITVLDISAVAIERAKDRLGVKAKQVNWIVGDIVNFTPSRKYQFWNDRAVFHFLTDEKDIARYKNTIENYLDNEGVLLLGTFSVDGPFRCSGIEIRQYSAEKMTSLFQKTLQKIRCFEVQHLTPFDTIQNFLFCIFRKSLIENYS